eukprot:symbB.v1.2.004031.t2/scaffold227.1/size261201/17
MLNAVALNGIMDVDELLFCGFTPVSVQRTLRKLKPIKMQYSRARSQIESLLLFMLLAATMLIPYFVYLEPLGAGMVTIKHEMCGGNQTFVVAFNPEVQEVVGLTTKSGLYEEEPTLSEVAVEHHKFQTEGPPQYILFTNSWQIFDDLRSSPMTNAAAKLPFCPETDALQASGPFYHDPLVTPILETRLRSAAVALGIPPTSAWSCEDLAHECSRPEARLLRLVCGETCGCTDPFASPWHKVQTQGCSDLCSLRGELSLATQKCDDQPKGGAWDEFWSGYPAAMGSYYGQNATQTAVWPLASSIAQQLQQLGCQGLRIPELQIEPASNVVWCHGSDTLFRPLAWLCPVSCGCLDQPQPYCPSNCRNGTDSSSKPRSPIQVGDHVKVRNTFIEVSGELPQEEGQSAERFTQSDPTPVLDMMRATATTTATAGGETVTVATPSSQAESVKEMTQQCSPGSSWLSPPHVVPTRGTKPLVLKGVKQSLTGSWLPLPASGWTPCAVVLAAMAQRQRVARLARTARPRRESWPMDELPPEMLEDAEEDLENIREKLKMKPMPKRLPSTRGVPFVGHKGSPTDEELEAMVAQEVPEHRSAGGNFDPHRDNPLTKGVDIMTKAGKALERMICCRGCGVPLQTHDPNNVGYIRFAKYLEKRSQKLHRKLLCSRCLELDRGDLVPVVKETLADDQVGFGGQVVPADVLARQLATIRQRRCMVVYVVDVLDFNGSFIRRIREIVGRNPVIIVGTKIDLLPPKTDMQLVNDWLLYTLRKKKMRIVEVKLVSNETGKGINHAVNAIIEHRSGMDVFVVGAANAGKSAFIRRLLDRLEVKFPQGKVEQCERPTVSRTPGTTLGLIQLRAFRRSAISPVFASLYDTPGVHQPNSMQNLLPIDEYNYVQPTRHFAVHTVTPAKDVLAQLKASDEAVSHESLQRWLGRSVRYLWGFPNQKPVLAVEVYPPISAMLKLSFVGVHNLAITCQANVPGAGEDGRGYPEAPEGMDLSQICYVKTPDALSMDGQVACDLSLTGFGWVAVSFAALNSSAAGRPMERSKVTMRIYGPKRLKVVQNEFPMPVAGLPGYVEPPPEESLADEEDDADYMEESRVLSQPWMKGLGQSVGGMLTAAPGGGTGGDKDEEAAIEVADPVAPQSRLIDSEEDLEREIGLGGDELSEMMAFNRPRRRFFQPEDDPFDFPLGNKDPMYFLKTVVDLDDGTLPMDDFDEEGRYDGPMPELALGGKLPPAVEGDPFGEDWADLPSNVASSFSAPSRQQVQTARRPPSEPRERGKKHFWYGMTREEIKEAKAKGQTSREKQTSPAEGEKSSFMKALEKRDKARPPCGWCWKRGARKEARGRRPEAEANSKGSSRQCWSEATHPAVS